MNRPVTSASNLFRRALCPGSQRMEAGLPEDDSPQSREGRLLHDFAAHPQLDRSFLKPFQRDLLERNDELIKSIMERLGRLCPSTPSPPASREVSLKNDMISGTPDLLVLFPQDDAALVNDTKFGAKIVERADLNLQLRAYAVLVYDALAQKPQPLRIFVSITQPRLGYDERISLAEYMSPDIELARNNIADILEASSREDAPLIAGEEQCRYCKAKLICPEFRRVFGDLALAVSEDGMSLLSLAKRRELIEKRLLELTDEEMTNIGRAITFAGYINDLWKEEARKRIAEGKLTDYFLSKPAKERKLIDPQRAIALLSLAKIQSREELLQICSIPLGKIEDAYRKTKGCTWKEAREKIDKILANVIETREEKPRVIRK